MSPRIRRAGPADAEQVADAYLLARAAAERAGTIPRGVHAEVDVRAWMADRVREDEVWVAETGGGIAGFARLEPGRLEALYVRPEAQGEGFGSALLDHAKARHDELSLWVFVSNAPARAFYAGRGFAEVERTDGAANEERAPDIRMVWRRPDPPTANADPPGTAR